MSTDFCKSGKVRLKEEVLKPSSLIQVGQTLEIKKNGFNLFHCVEMSNWRKRPAGFDLLEKDDLSTIRDHDRRCPL